MTLHRLSPLPQAPARGALVVTTGVVERTEALLLEAGRLRPPHEGLVWWAGRQIGKDTLVLACHRPQCQSGPQFVFTDEHAAGAAARLARSAHLGIVAQVHSHPGTDTRHSDGDDELVLMPFENMFSLVAARYGEDGLLEVNGASVHQYQDGRWIRVRQDGPALTVVPAELDDVP